MPFQLDTFQAFAAFMHFVQEHQKLAHFMSYSNLYKGPWHTRSQAELFNYTEVGTTL